MTPQPQPQYHRDPSPFTEWTDNRTAAEIRRDMALMRIHDRYARPVRGVGVNRRKPWWARLLSSARRLFTKP